MTLEHSKIFCLLLSPIHSHPLSRLPTVSLSADISRPSYLILLHVLFFIFTFPFLCFWAVRFLPQKTQPSSYPSVTQERCKRGSSKGRVQFMCNRRSPVKGRVMSLAFGRLWRCSLVSYQTRLTKTLRMPNVSRVSFFSYKECAKNSPTHACCLSFCLISL